MSFNLKLPGVDVQDLPKAAYPPSPHPPSSRPRQEAGQNTHRQHLTRYTSTMVETHRSKNENGFVRGQMLT